MSTALCPSFVVQTTFKKSPLLTAPLPQKPSGFRGHSTHKCCSYVYTLGSPPSRSRRAPPASVTATDADYSVRIATPRVGSSRSTSSQRNERPLQELWAVADVHVAAFYPKTFSLFHPWIKLDRVLALLEGQDHDANKTGTRFRFGQGLRQAHRCVVDLPVSLLGVV